MKNELFKFDIIETLKEELNKKQAAEKFKKELCDFTGKLTFNADDLDKAINNPPFIESTINAVWTPTQGPILSINMIEIIERNFGLIPGETTKDKVDWIRDNFTIEKDMNLVVKQKEVQNGK